jgi:hypothetical protein
MENDYELFLEKCLNKTDISFVGRHIKFELESFDIKILKSNSTTEVLRNSLVNLRLSYLKCLYENQIGHDKLVANYFKRTNSKTQRFNFLTNLKNFIGDEIQFQKIPVYCGVRVSDFYYMEDFGLNYLEFVYLSDDLSSVNDTKVIKVDDFILEPENIILENKLGVLTHSDFKELYYFIIKKDSIEFIPRQKTINKRVKLIKVLYVE